MRSTLLLSATISVLACGGGSPTAPADGGIGDSGLTIVFSSPSAFGSNQPVIQSHIETTFQQASREISLGGLVVTVNSNPSRLIPGWGLGGFTQNATNVEIAIASDVSAATLAARLPPLAAHEFHHAARFRGPGYGATLLAAMVSEGLADHYASELSGQPLPPWVLALSGPEIDTWIERARPEFDSTSYDHAAWFFGRGGEIPNWAGYAIGFRLVGDYLAAHPGSTAASLVNLGADSFRPDAGS